MNIALTLSRHTSNNLSSLLSLPFHYVLGQYNLLVKALEEEKKAQGGSGEGSSAMGGFHMPSSMSFAGPNGTSSVKF
jgi:hypothetical protein